MRGRRRGLESDLGVCNAWRVGPTEDYRLQWVLVAPVLLVPGRGEGRQETGTLGRRWSWVRPAARRMLALLSLLPHAHAAR